MSFGNAGLTNVKLAGIIGRCAAAWSKLESQLALSLGSIMGVENSVAVAVFTALRTNRAAEDILQAAAAESLSGEVYELFEALLKEFRRRSKDRNAIVHGLWGQVHGVEDAVLWCDVQQYSVWHLQDYHRGATGKLTHEWRVEQMMSTYIWSLSDLEQTVREIIDLERLVGQFHVYLRYEHESALQSLRDALFGDE